MLGGAAGGISLLVFPFLFLETLWARLFNLLLTPLAAGEAMAALGALRRSRGRRPVRLDEFFHGYAFALAMATVRLAFCE